MATTLTQYANFIDGSLVVDLGPSTSTTIMPWRRCRPGAGTARQGMC